MTVELKRVLGWVNDKTAHGTASIIKAADFTVNVDQYSVGKNKGWVSFLKVTINVGEVVVAYIDSYIYFDLLTVEDRISEITIYNSSEYLRFMLTIG